MVAWSHGRQLEGTRYFSQRSSGKQLIERSKFSVPPLVNNSVNSSLHGASDFLPSLQPAGNTVLPITACTQRMHKFDTHSLLLASAANRRSDVLHTDHTHSLLIVRVQTVMSILERTGHVHVQCRLCAIDRASTRCTEFLISTFFDEIHIKHHHFSAAG